MTTQTAPWPTKLEWLVRACKYREGWKFVLKPDSDRGQESEGTTLEIIIDCVDTYAPDQDIRIRHLFIVPAASYNMRSWRRWLFDRILDVEKHEAMEFFQIDGARPYAPNHGPGHDPYIIFEEGTVQEKRTSYLGQERSTDSPYDGFGPELDVSLRARLSAVISEADRGVYRGLSGVELDRIAHKYGLLRMGLNNDKDGDVPHA
jgi:hypothetical protein